MLSLSPCCLILCYVLPVMLGVLRSSRHLLVSFGRPLDLTSCIMNKHLIFLYIGHWKSFEKLPPICLWIQWEDQYGLYAWGIQAWFSISLWYVDCGGQESYPPGPHCVISITVSALVVTCYQYVANVTSPCQYYVQLVPVPRPIRHSAMVWSWRMC